MIRFEKATFTLPLLFGSLNNKNLVAKLQKFAEKKYDLTLPIHSFYGAPTNALWNGGRPPYYSDSIIDDSVSDYYDEIGANCYLTYTNHLAGDYLDDPVSNLSLEKLSGSDNGVIITDERLNSYVRKNFPHLKTKASVIKSTKEMPHERTTDYYNSLLDRYDFVVLHPDDNTNLDLIDSIKDKDRLEVLIDERCTKDCRVRDLHYDVNAQYNIPIENRDSDILNQEVTLWDKLCPREKSITLRNGKEKLDVLVNNNKEIQDLYDMGIYKYKTSGRGSQLREVFAIQKFLWVAIDDEDTRNTLEYFL